MNSARTHRIDFQQFMTCMKKKGFTQEKLAAQTGLSINTIKKIRQGKSILMSSCVEIAKSLDVTPDQLILDESAATDATFSSGQLESRSTCTNIEVPTAAQQTPGAIGVAINLFRCNRFREAREIFQPLASDEQNPIALTHLGWIFQNGLDVSIDLVKAASYYKQAADKGYGNGQCNYAWMCQHGLGVPVDFLEARRFYELAASQGESLAMNQLGWLFQTGTGVPEDHELAVFWYRRSAALGDPNGLNNLGWAYHMGLGVPPNREHAIECYRKAIELGNHDAQRNLQLLTTKPVTT